VLDLATQKTLTYIAYVHFAKLWNKKAFLFTFVKLLSMLVSSFLQMKAF